MKKQYITPSLIGERFLANEYISACGDSGKVYKFKCNAGSKRKEYNVYLSDGSPYCTSGKDYGNKEIWGWEHYSPCYDEQTGEGYHEAESDSVFLKGYMYEQGYRGADTGEKIDVIIWTENYTNCHCTTDLNISSWETAKS